MTMYEQYFIIILLFVCLVQIHPMGYGWLCTYAKYKFLYLYCEQNFGEVSKFGPLYSMDYLHYIVCLMFIPFALFEREWDVKYITRIQIKTWCVVTVVRGSGKRDLNNTKVDLSVEWGNKIFCGL